MCRRRPAVRGSQESRVNGHSSEDRGWRIEDRVIHYILDPPSSILDPRSSLSSILDPQTFSGTTNGSRYLRRSMPLALPSLTICSFARSNSIERPTRYEMLARCTNADERWPSSMSAFKSSRLRLRTALMKFSQLLPPSRREGPGSCFLPRKVLSELYPPMAM